MVKRQAVTIDEAPLNAFHLKIAALTTGGMFCDGYILGIIGMALTQIGPQMHLNALWSGLIGSSALIGIFFGSLVFGWITDQIGRQTIYVIDLVALIIGSVLQFFVQNSAELFVLRLLMGLAIGADYALGPALLSEFLPRKYRGPLLGTLNMIWTVGYVAAMIVGYAIQGIGPNAWRWMLASSAVPAAVVMLFRLGTPESPRWLISKGRIEEARRIVKQYIGPDVEINDLLAEGHAKSNFRKLFTKRLRKRTAFGGLFWFCQVVPYFAIFTFVPEIMKDIHLTQPFLGSLLLNLFLLVGSIVGVLIMNMLPRRLFLNLSFAILTVSLLVLGIWPNIPQVVMVCFTVFAFVVSAAADLESVYPSEIFPTEIRASGVGFCAAVSRVGAATGTFLLPASIQYIGLGPTMLIGALILFIGLLVSAAWAPETRSLRLLDASMPEITSESRAAQG